MADSQKSTMGMNAYWKTRNYKTSARLHLQHHLFQNTIEYLLHPQITESWKQRADTSEAIKIADLGCGNGKWLIDVSKTESAGTALQLHGFDINPVNFPAQCYLPKNIKLQKLDILSGDLPAGLAKSFDIVHIRAFTSCVLDNDPSKVLKTATALLKPGGWLQWEETPPDQLTAIAPDENTSKASCDKIIMILTQLAKAQKLAYSWLYDLEARFREWDLQETRMSDYSYKPEDFKAWTENYLTVWEELDQLLPSREVAPNSPVTKEMWQDLFLEAVDETSNGVVVGQQKIILVIGRLST